VSRAILVWPATTKCSDCRVLCSLQTARSLRAVCFGAPGRAHSLGGESPLLARQGEELAERQGCSGRLEIWRKPKAKRWPDYRGADTRRHGGVSRPISVKPDTCTERRDVDPTGISVTSRRRRTPEGRSRAAGCRHERSEAAQGGCVIPGEICTGAEGDLCASAIVRWRDACAEVSRGHRRRKPKGRTWKTASRRREHMGSQ